MMNRTWRSVFSVLLAIALLLPVVPSARAEEVGDGGAQAEDVTPEKAVALSAEKSTIYWRADKAGEVTVTATVKPDDYEGDIVWSWTTSLLDSVENSGKVSGGQATIKLKARSGSAGQTAEVSATVDGASSDPVKIEIKADTLDTSSIAFTQKELSVEVNKTVQTSLNKEPVYSSGEKATVTYESSNPTVATVDEKTGLVTGKTAGKSATIWAKVKVGDNIIKLNSEVVVSVTIPSASELTGNATLGTDFSMRNIYSTLLKQFSASYNGAEPKKIYFSSLNTIHGTLTRKDGTPVQSYDLSKSNQYDFSELLDMYLDLSSGGSNGSEGDFTCTVTVTDGTNQMEGRIKITVSIPSYTARVPISGGANYSFSSASADSSGKTGAQLIKEAIGAFGSIKFDSVPDSNVGTLYSSSPASNNNRVSVGTVVSASTVGELYFIPNRAGTYTVTFTAYDGYNSSMDNVSGRARCKGTLILSVDSGSLDISYSLDSLDPYTFSSGTNNLYNKLLTAINNSVGGSSWGGIKFDGAASASSTGTLHRSSSYSAITASEYIAKAYISQLYYVPARAGTYEITYGVYANETSDKAITTGKLTIKTSTISISSPDLIYTTSVKDSITLQEDDFIDFFQEENGSKYQLSYVIFEAYEGDGTFYHGSNSFLPYNSADFYTSTYSGSLSASARYLNRVSFTAPSAAGYTAVKFTCYGGKSTSSTETKTTGKLCIFYTADDVPAVSYNVFNVASVDFKEADFVTVYNAAMKTSISKPVFTVQLLSAPNKGTLYHYYSDNSRRALTSSSVADYNFMVNSSAGSSVSKLTYVPGNKGTGTDEINYLAMSPDGEVLYVGAIQFKLSSDLTLYVTNDGSDFQLSDFYDADDKDPVLYVTFPQPSAGKIYVYADGRYIVAPTGTKFYTTSALNGQYPLTSAFYAPKANEIGTVSLKYTVYRKSGATNSNTITMNILNKLSSGTFGDVNGVFDWAANSIDFANKMGLVKGTDTRVNPPRFSPGNTMRRSDFVLMLYRLAGSPAVSGPVPYTDVTSDKYYYDSAVWAYRNNIMRNVTFNNLYDPEGALTRQDFAQILFNYTAAMGESTANSGSIASYADASSVSSNTVEGVTWAVAKGYITSAVVGRLYIEPARAATRAEISTLLHRYLTY